MHAGTQFRCALGNGTECLATLLSTMRPYCQRRILSVIPLSIFTLLPPWDFVTLSSATLDSKPPKWTFYWLWAAGIYNLVWGAITIAFPFLLFDVTGTTRPNFPEIWQCVGMIVGVYGIGYICAAYDSRRHWPVVLVGFLGKIFGPIGFLGALLKGVFPPLFGITILTNDLIWWIPFFLMLKDAWIFNRSRPTAT